MSAEPKTGGNKDIHAFIKGNADLQRVFGLDPQANGGVSQSLRAQLDERFAGAFQLHAAWEPAAGGRLEAQALAWNQESAPPAFVTRATDLFLSTQFNSDLWRCDDQQPPDIVFFSLQPDLLLTPWTQREAGYLLCPPCDWQTTWSEAWQKEFTDAFIACEPTSAAQYKSAMSTIIRAIKERLSAHVIIMNASTIVPGDQVTNYAAQPKTWARSIHQLNFALIELSIAEGISIIDVDRIAAESGGLAEVSGVFGYSSKIYTNIAREILRVMGEIGFFEKRPLVPQVGQR